MLQDTVLTQARAHPLPDRSRMRHLQQDQARSSQGHLARKGHRDSSSSRVLLDQDSSSTTLYLNTVAGRAPVLHSLVARCKARRRHSLMDSRDLLREELRHIFSLIVMQDRTQDPPGRVVLRLTVHLVHLALQVRMASRNKEDILNSSSHRRLKLRSSVLTRPRSLVLLSRPSVCSM